VSDINAFLDNYHASIVSASRGGMFRLQFGGRPTDSKGVADLMSRLQGEKIVNLAVPAQ
jgi:hypothetical protein